MEELLENYDEEANDLLSKDENAIQLMFTQLIEHYLEDKAK